MRKFILLTAITLTIGSTLLAFSSNAPEATCKGDTPCNACKNCKYCKHCAKEGGTCGICKRN